MIYDIVPKMTSNMACPHGSVPTRPLRMACLALMPRRSGVQI